MSIQTDPCIGVSQAAQAFKAHAWVEYRDHPLNAALDIRQRLTPLDIFANGDFPAPESYR